MTSDAVVPKGAGPVRLRVSPGAGSTELRGLYGDAALKLEVAAPPVDGKANAESGRFVAGKTDAVLSGAPVVRGLSGRVREVLTPRPR